MQAFIARISPLLFWFVMSISAQPSPLTIPYGVAVAGADRADQIDTYFQAATNTLNQSGMFGEFVRVDWAAWDSVGALDGAVLVTDLNGELMLRYVYSWGVTAREQSPLLEDVNLPVVPLNAPHSLDYLMASVLYGSGTCDLAAPYEQAVAGVPAVATALRLAAGNCYLLHGDEDQAIDILTPLALEHPTAANNLAYILLSSDSDAAFALLDDLVADAAATGNVTLQAAALARRAGFHARAFNFDPAIADISAAIALRPGYAPYYKQRGDHIFLIYEWDRVLADYNAALLIDPAYADAYYARAVLFYTQGPRPRAMADYQRFIDLAPNDPRVNEARANITSIQAELEALGGDDTGAFGPSD
jgi:tetratricopeptide (TPR) repeat protein